MVGFKETAIFGLGPMGKFFHQRVKRVLFKSRTPSLRLQVCKTCSRWSVSKNWFGLLTTPKVSLDPSRPRTFCLMEHVSSSKCGQAAQHRMGMLGGNHRTAHVRFQLTRNHTLLTMQMQIVGAAGLLSAFSFSAILGLTLWNTIMLACVHVSALASGALWQDTADSASDLENKSGRVCLRTLVLKQRIPFPSNVDFFTKPRNKNFD